MNKVLVLGVGNLLLSDDGVGIHAIRRLQDETQLLRCRMRRVRSIRSRESQ